MLGKVSVVERLALEDRDAASRMGCLEVVDAHKDAGSAFVVAVGFVGPLRAEP